MPAEGPEPADLANLEFTPDEMTRMGRLVLDRCVAHVAALAGAPSRGDVDAAAVCRDMWETAPEEPRALETLLDSLLDDWVPRSFTTAGPGYLAYVPGGGLFPATLAEIVANTTNRFVGVFGAAPCLATLEANVIDWIRDWMQFPQTARGVLTSGGSMSTLGAIVTAREWLLGADIRSGVLYKSSQGHHSIDKAARLAGIQGDRIVQIGVDDQFRMRTDELRDRIAADRARGLRPFLVASSAGTVGTGAVDPLDDIADICKEHELWHHVDGAYGGFFHVVPELRPLLAGLSRADSLALDPHKGLFLPYGTGALLVRDGEKLRAAHAAHAGYLPDTPGDEFYDMSMYGPELSRPFRGLRVWMAVQLYGARKLRAAIAEKRALALHAHEVLAEVPGIRIAAPPQLSLFAFWLTLEGSARSASSPSTLEDDNAATRELIERVTRRGDVMLSGTMDGGRFYGRICVLSFRTRRRVLETGLAQIAEEAARLRAQH